MATAIVLILLGLLGPVAAAQWRAGRWLRPAAWIGTKLSPPFLAGVPMICPVCQESRSPAAAITTRS